jgi:hypothetical protein
LKKPNFYGSRRAFDAGAPHDGFLLEGKPAALSLTARILGRMYRLDQLANGGGYCYHDGTATVRISADGAITPDPSFSPPRFAHVVDIGRFHAIATLLRGITDSTRVHAINTPLLTAAQN